MGNLYPAKGALIEVDSTTGIITKTLTVDGYAYGLEAVPQDGAGKTEGCDYAAVVVQGSVESAPFVACIGTSGVADGGSATVTKIASLGAAYGIVSSGTFGSHLYDAATHTYHVVAARKNASAVFSADVAAKTVTSSVFDARNSVWDPTSNCTTVAGGVGAHPVGLVVRGAGANGLYAVAAKKCLAESGMNGPLSNVYDRRQELWYAKLSLGAAAKLDYLFPLPGLKLGDAETPSFAGGFGQAVPFGGQGYAAIFVDDTQAPGHTQLVLGDGKGGNTVHPWPFADMVATFDRLVAPGV